MLSLDQREALQEIANVGMGHAGASIAQLLGEFVRLSIPRVFVLPPHEACSLLADAGMGECVRAVRQGFHGGLRGEAIAIYAEKGCSELGDLMGYEGADCPAESELLLDVSNLIVGGCLGAIAAQLHIDIGFSAPSVMADRVPASDLLAAESLPWTSALLIEVRFGLEGRSFGCHLVFLMAQSEINAAAHALDAFLVGM